MIWVYSIQKDEALMAPYFVRHYGVFADKIIIYDGGSTDGTLDVFNACPKVEIRTSSGIDRLDDMRFHKISHSCYKEARGKADWIIFVDADEFIWHPDIVRYLDQEKRYGSQVLRPCGFNMVSERFIRHETKQIYEVMPMGVRAPVYSKPVVLDPEIDISWQYGKHEINEEYPMMRCIVVWSELKLLHYRFLNFDFTKQRNERNWSRVPQEIKRGGFGWTNNPDHHGECSPRWAASLKGSAFNVLTAENKF